MNSQGANDVSPEAMQARIQQARREAETLKDRIKRKKDELSDTSRTCSIGQHGRHRGHDTMALRLPCRFFRPLEAALG